MRKRVVQTYTQFAASGETQIVLPASDYRVGLWVSVVGGLTALGQQDTATVSFAGFTQRGLNIIDVGPGHPQWFRREDFGDGLGREIVISGNDNTGQLAFRVSVMEVLEID